MADAIDLNMLAVKALAADLNRIRGRLQPAMRAVTAKGALNIKNAAKASILAQTQHKYVKQYPNSITYTVTESSGTRVSAEIGPDKDKPQGALGNLLEFGSPENGAPKPHLVPAWEDEAEPYEQFMATAAENAIFGET